MKSPRAIVVSLFIGLLGFASQPANAAVPVIDPSNLAVNIQQALQHLEMIRRMEEQIRNQLLMLENWKFTRLDDLLGDMHRMQETLTRTGDMNADYPITENQGLANHQTIQVQRERWVQQQRQTIVQARTAQNVAYEQMRSSQTRIAEYIQRSNAAPGPTSAVQAGNETIATRIAQLQSLQALEIANTQAELERLAERQARLSQSNQLRELLFRDWVPQNQLAIGRFNQNFPSNLSSNRKPVRQPFRVD